MAFFNRFRIRLYTIVLAIRVIYAMPIGDDDEDGLFTFCIGHVHEGKERGRTLMITSDHRIAWETEKQLEAAGTDSPEASSNNELRDTE